jgi:hypothetical protein
LIDRRWHSSILDVRSFRGADYDTDHYLVVTKVRERLAVSKQAAKKFDAERFHLKKLSELEVRKLIRKPGYIISWSRGNIAVTST